MPGMFDCHVHLAAFNAASFANYRVAIFEVTPELQSFYALYHAQIAFEMGFTTLRDLGRPTTRGQFVSEICAVRDAINAGIVPGPRLLVCGRSIITNSHSDLLLPRAAPRGRNATADGPWELRRLTREHLRTGVDLIKTCASGGAGSDKLGADVRNMTQEEIDAIVDEAHAFHKPVSAHCFTAESHRMCVRAGVDTIEHIVFTDNETISMILDSGIPVVPTLLHRTDEAIAVRERLGTPSFVLNKMRKIQPHCFESFQRMHDAGIKMAMGTDLGVDPENGSNAKELEIYVELGMSPMEAIQTATKNAAESLGLGEDLGTLEAGKLADVIIVDRNPLDEIAQLQARDNIRFVMKEGRAYVDKLSRYPKCVLSRDPEEIPKIDAA
jgi:imidazolonepropionase-like amidohydrolase